MSPDCAVGAFCIRLIIRDQKNRDHRMVDYHRKNPLRQIRQTGLLVYNTAHLETYNCILRSALSV
jgi:hypothetical protein